MGFQSSYSIPEFIDPHSTPKTLSTPIRPLSFYQPLRESHRPQGVNIDHFGYPWSKSMINQLYTELQNFDMARFNYFQLGFIK
ncbi:hypothetical protein T09_10737 [Trichinella sp. T9]|nr:hypothetical protein T09_10737 [Trichinella sp. T9]